MKKQTRLNEEMQEGVSINEYQEKAVYNEDISSKDYYGEWQKRNNKELSNTIALNFNQNFLIIDENCKIVYDYPRKVSESGKLLDEPDTSKNKRLCFSWYDKLNEGHILKLYISPEQVKQMYSELDPCKDWDIVFPFVTYKTRALLTVNTKFRKFCDTETEKLKNGKYAFIAYPSLMYDKKGNKWNEVVKNFTSVNEKTEEEYTYYLHILSNKISELQLVKIED